MKVGFKESAEKCWRRFAHKGMPACAVRIISYAALRNVLIYSVFPQVLDGGMEWRGAEKLHFGGKLTRFADFCVLLP
jgi:hypothetical protein